MNINIKMKAAVESMPKSLALFTNRDRVLRRQSPKLKSTSLWADLLDRNASRWNSVCAATKKGPRILLANAYGLDSNTANVASMLAVALTIRGAQVHFLLCDEALPACWVSQFDRVTSEEFIKSGVLQNLCGTCFSGTNTMIQSLGLSIHRYSELITSEEVERAQNLSSNLSVNEMVNFRLDDLAVGEQALSGALRFYARGTLEGEPDGEAVLGRYFNAALRTVFATRRLMNTFSFAAVSSLHGIYIPEGMIGEVAREQGVRVTTWSFAYRKRTFIFTHHDTYHHTLLTESPTIWENMPWTPEMETQIVDYLNSRRYGTQDWIKFVEHPKEDLDTISAELGVDFSKPSVGLLTNVLWDAQVHFRGNAFPNMLEWLLQTISYFSKRTDLQLVIRVHPGELLGHTRARQTAMEEIKRAFPSLPKNVFVIPPESTISTYSAMSQCNAVLIYGTKAGVEITSMGIPVIVAGEAWIRNKGVTFDAGSVEEYFKLLDRLPLKEQLSEADKQRARKYAYHFFFRRMIPLPFTAPPPGVETEPEVEDIDDLSPGKHTGLDVICNGILNGAEFIYPAELYPANSDATSQVNKEDRARVSLRIVDMLGKLGELERMQAQLLETLGGFPGIASATWARPSIVRNVNQIALASNRPIASLFALWMEMKETTDRLGIKQQLIMRRLLAHALMELAIRLWKRGSYQMAGRAAVHALVRDPTQPVRKVMLKRLMRALFRS